ncbi:MAG: hypothetical protein QOJ91_1077 [Sphingomonadales bacterium]|jgi:hypothetical protein|nr:hypothetical protein [Sphingomonadales bacterium]
MLEIDPQTLSLVERHRRSACESAADILKRVLPLVPIAAAPSPPLAAILPPPPSGTRRRGQWAVEICGERIPAANLKSAWRTLLQALDARYPDFLERLAEETGRARRFVARSAASLYDASPHLAGRHAEPLSAGWNFDSNVSTVQVARRARVSARICGLRYGADVRILENLREI